MVTSFHSFESTTYFLFLNIFFEMMELFPVNTASGFPITVNNQFKMRIS